MSCVSVLLWLSDVNITSGSKSCASEIKFSWRCTEEVIEIAALMCSVSIYTVLPLKDLVRRFNIIMEWNRLGCYWRASETLSDLFNRDSLYMRMSFLPSDL